MAVKDYHTRILTFDPKTQLYQVEVKELGIVVTADTEVSALVEARSAVQDAARRPPPPPPEEEETYSSWMPSPFSFNIPKGTGGAGSGQTTSWVGKKIRILQDNLDSADVRFGDVFEVEYELLTAIAVTPKCWVFEKHNLGSGFEVIP